MQQFLTINASIALMVKMIIDAISWKINGHESYLSYLLWLAIHIWPIREVWQSNISFTDSFLGFL